MTPDELYKLDYESFDNIINKIFYPAGGQSANLLLVNFFIENEIVLVNYLVVNTFAESKLSNVNFSNSDLTGVSFYGTEIADVDFLGADMRCTFHDTCQGTLTNIIQ